MNVLNLLNKGIHVPIRKIKVFVAVCPTCGKKVSLSGESKWDGYETQQEIKTALDWPDGCFYDVTLDEAIAEACSSSCALAYLKSKGKPQKNRRVDSYVKKS